MLTVLELEKWRWPYNAVAANEMMMMNIGSNNDSDQQYNGENIDDDDDDEDNHKEGEEGESSTNHCMTCHYHPTLALLDRYTHSLHRLFHTGNHNHVQKDMKWLLQLKMLCSTVKPHAFNLHAITVIHAIKLSYCTHILTTASLKQQLQIYQILSNL